MLCFRPSQHTRKDAMRAKKRKLTHDLPVMPAVTAIRDCGGPKVTAAICGVSVKAVYAWRESVPARHQERIKIYLEYVK